MQPLRSHLLSAILRTPPEFAAYTGQMFVELLHKAVAAAALTAVTETSFNFEPYGVSAVVLLKESHVAAHFWPEYGKMSIDIHVCDYHNDNFQRALALAEALSFASIYPENRYCWRYNAVSG